MESEFQMYINPKLKTIHLIFQQIYVAVCSILCFFKKQMSKKFILVIFLMKKQVCPKLDNVRDYPNPRYRFNFFFKSLSVFK